MYFYSNQGTRDKRWCTGVHESLCTYLLFMLYPLSLYMLKTQGFDSVLNKWSVLKLGNLTEPSIWLFNYWYFVSEYVAIWFQWVFFHQFFNLVFFLYYGNVPCTYTSYTSYYLVVYDCSRYYVYFTMLYKVHCNLLNCTKGAWS